MKRQIHLFSSSHKSKKILLFFVLMIFLLLISFCLLRFCYESCFLLYRQTRKAYKSQKRFMPIISENDITQLKQRVTTKLQEKKKYEKMLHGKSKLFEYYKKIRDALANTSTLTHCAISSTTISVSAENLKQDEADRVLELLQNDECFSMVKIRSSEKMANDGYSYTIVIMPKQSGKKVKKK